MNRLINKILKKIENNGYEAYVVGGYVRDYLLGKKSYDIDICTNAILDDSNSFGCLNIKYKNYNIDITTFRKELEYTKRKPTKLLYIDSLEEDLQRRDFTINAICMDKNKKIIDLFDGVNDLNNKKIRMIGNVNKKLKEDPLRILRALRFATILDFELDNKLIEGIEDNISLINTLTPIRVRQELTKILLNKNYLKGLSLLKKYKVLKVLEISYKDLIYINNEYAMWAQLETTKNFGFTKRELVNIINIRQIINKGVIDNFILYKYGLSLVIIISEIYNINKNIIKKMYKKLPIKNDKELKITTEEIIKILNIKDYSIINDLKEELINLILEGKLKNKKSELIKYIKRNEM